MSSLDQALANSLSGIKVAEQLIANASGNIANYKTENYAKRDLQIKSLTTAGSGNGAVVSAVVRKIDQSVYNAIIDQISTLEYSKSINDYNQQIQLLFGSPGSNSTIDFAINDFFSSLKLLSNNPEYTSLRFDTINKAKNLTEIVSNLANNLQQLRYNADDDIKSEFDYINGQLQNLYSVNAALSKITTQDDAQANLIQNRDDIVRNIAEKINIQTYYKSNNQVILSTSNGIPLINENLYNIDYDKITSVTTLINDNILSEVALSTTNSSGDIIDNHVLIASGISNNNLNSVIKNGSIAALKELRDNAIPKILAQLDNLSVMISDKFNEVHNSGSGFPPLSTMIGTRPIYGGDIKSFSGDVRIALVDEEGNPALLSNGSKLNPFNLNLSNLKSASVSGQYDINTIVNEINQYFYTDPTQNKTTIGNLDDVRIVASSPLSAEPNGIFSFDFELTNYSQIDSSFEILSVDVNDNLCSGLVGNLPNSYSIKAGGRERTGAPIQINFAGGAGGPYNISVKLKITDENNRISIATVDYQINDNPGYLNIENQRYYAKSILSNNGSITQANNVTQYALASVVNEDGNAVGFNEAGYLKIESLNENYYLVIDDLNSQDITVTNPTNKGFSEFFELNDLFIRNKKYDQYTGNALIENSALNLSIRDDIIANPNLISMSKLTRSQSYYESQVVGYTNASANFKLNGNPSIGDSININGINFSFVSSAIADNQINIGADLPTTLSNIVSKLSLENSTNSGYVDVSSYNSNGIDTINIIFNAKGEIGNSFTINGSFANTTANINSQQASSNPSGNLVGGSDYDATVLVNPWSYNIGKGNSDAIEELYDISNNNYNFTQAGGLNSSYSSFAIYVSSIISYGAEQANLASYEEEKESNIKNAYEDRFSSATGINIDQELINITQYQLYYSASAQVVKITRELYRELLNVFN